MVEPGEGARGEVTRGKTLLRPLLKPQVGTNPTRARLITRPPLPLLLSARRSSLHLPSFLSLTQTDDDEPSTNQRRQDHGCARDPS